MVKTGLDIIHEIEAKTVFEGSVGLVVNPASIDSSYMHAADIFFDHSDINLTALFGPQHGIRGETQDNMIEWATFKDPFTGLPAYSLYGETRQPTDEMLSAVDTLVFDVPDVGTRIYTFIWTMELAMEKCAQLGKKFVVLDRPNPIGGVEVEGNVLDPDYASFVGLRPIPMRHGMTVGELAKMFNQEFGIGCNLEVVEMTGWGRDMLFPETGQPWVMPSPNMPTIDTAIVYPGAVLFEGINISEGRGTTRPFELVGAPWIDARSLSKTMNEKDLPGVYFRPAHFQPTFHKHCGEICGGVQMHVKDARAFRPYITTLHLIVEMRNQSIEKFAWTDPPYEYVYDKKPIDVMLGTNDIRKKIESGIPVNEIESSWLRELEIFMGIREKYLLY